MFEEEKDNCLVFEGEAAVLLTMHRIVNGGMRNAIDGKDSMYVEIVLESYTQISSYFMLFWAKLPDFPKVFRS